MEINTTDVATQATDSSSTEEPNNRIAGHKGLRDSASILTLPDYPLRKERDTESDRYTSLRAGKPFSNNNTMSHAPPTYRNRTEPKNRE